ncbi:MAG: hypothetical protein OXC27_15295 [Caldilineaceae bacterium]|nr:hypothetical protein [Caldilineaceae bacterium]
MSETIGSSQGPTDVAGVGKVERLRLRWVASGIIFVLALAVVILRFQRLSELPPGLSYDEGAHGVDSLSVLRGEHAVFFPESHGREGLIIYAIALTTSLMGRTILAVRLPTALASAGTVFAIFWLGHLLFGRDGETGRATPWRGLLVGGVAAGLLAVSLSQTIIGRTAFRVNFLPLLLCLCLCLLWEGWRRRSWRWVALAGATAGLLAYTYIAARFTPFLFFILGLSFLVPWGSSEVGKRGKDRLHLSLRFSSFTSRLRTEMPLAVVFAGVAGVVAAPILIYFALNPDQFFVRSDQVSVFQSDGGSVGPLRALVINVWEHLLAFGVRGDPSWRHNYPERPMLNIWEAFFFWIGVGTAVWRWRQPAVRLLLLWLALLLLPAMLSKDESVPHFLRMFGATPAMYLLTGVGVWETIRVLRERFMREQAKWTPHWISDDAKTSTVVGALVGGLILIQGAHTYRDYFHSWADATMNLRANETQQWQDLAQVLSTHPPSADLAYLIPSYAWHYSFEYLHLDVTQENAVYLSPINLTQKIELTLAAMDNVDSVKFADWDNDLVGGVATAEEHFVVLLRKNGRYLGTDEYGSLRIHTFTDIVLDPPWTLYQNLEPLTVHYDGGISLYAIAWGQGEKQLSPQQPLKPGEEQAMWVALKWQTADGLDVDYSISLRLHDAEGVAVYQNDDVLWNEQAEPTSLWPPTKEMVTLIYLDIPTDLEPGEYDMRLVVYDYATQKPTVEQGIWEAEKTLAILRVGELE